MRVAALLWAFSVPSQAGGDPWLSADAPASVAIATSGPDSPTLIATVDEGGHIQLRHPGPAGGDPLAGPVVATIGDELPADHMCFARDVHDGSLYLFSGGEHGHFGQYRVFTDAGQRVVARRVRTLTIGGETTSCVADDIEGVVYVTEPDVGVWRVQSDPETDAVREPAAMLEPFGALQNAAAVTLVAFEGSLHALVADEDAGLLRRLDKDGKVTGEIPFETRDGSVAGLTTGTASGDVAAVALEIEGAEGDSERRVELVPLGTLGTSPATLVANRGGDAVVQAVVETEPVATRGDAADDPAIWVHPTDPAQSLVLGTDKKGGLAVFDLSGRRIQFLADGRINNVDVRPGLGRSGGPAFIAAGTDRTNLAIALYGIDPGTRQVSRVDVRSIPTDFAPYGLCMYRNARSGKLYVFATSEDGLIAQWRLSAASGGKVDAKHVRTIQVGTVAEGCVADDDNGRLFVAEEDVGIWSYGAEPGAGDARTAVARVKPDGEMTDDVEGLAIYPKGRDGWLIASSQGSDSYAVYERQPPHRFRGLFRIRANAAAGIDGASETDGLDVTAAALPGFPDGLLVVQDGRNVEPEQPQNFKFASWKDIAAALGL